MNKIFYCCLFISLGFFFISCKDKEVEFSANNCKSNPQFIRTEGFDPKRSFFSTSEDRTMGLVLKESEQPGNPKARITKSIQRPSWKKGGWLAPILLDQEGNIYTAPAPFINIWDNPIENNNTIYKVDTHSGDMDVFFKLPFADSVNTDNPFGIISMAYLCQTGTLYVSTVAGSRRNNENGHIYAINIKTKKIIDKIKNTDALGLGITFIKGKRELYFGSGRSSDVYCVTLSSSGKFSGKPRLAFTIANLGQRGDDKVRKIRTDRFGNLLVHGMEFNFNLIAPREKQETIYYFKYSEEEKKWIYSK